MKNTTRPLSLLAATLGVSFHQPALAQAADKKLGRVHLETSCTLAAATVFDRGMLYQHSFWYRAS